MKEFKALPEKMSDIAGSLKRYLPILFCLLLAVVYGFLVYRVQVLDGQEPASSDVAAKSRTAQVPHIDENALKQLKSLQDNSVSVKSLFSGSSRSNPFQE